MSPWFKPQYTERAWCVFEIHAATQAKKTIKILMPKADGEGFRSALLSGEVHAMFDALAGIRIQHARASIPEDKVRILESIDPDVQDGEYDSSKSIATLNKKVRDRLKMVC